MLDIAILDSGALFRRLPTNHTLAKTYITHPAVLAELRDQDTREYIQSLPFPIQTRLPSSTSIKQVVDCAKRTGDFATLSLVDMQVIALAHTLHQECIQQKQQISCMVDELKNTSIALHQTCLKDHLDDSGLDHNGKDNTVLHDIPTNHDTHGNNNNHEQKEEKEVNHDKKAEKEEEEVNHDKKDKEEEEEDEQGWITVNNVDQHLARDTSHAIPIESHQDTSIACLTGDFAMQVRFLFIPATQH